MQPRTIFAGALLAASAALTSGAAIAAPVFDGNSLNSQFEFNDALLSTDMSVAYDGSSYWTATGGSTSGLRLARHNNSGALISRYAAGLDFRSLFTDQNGGLYASVYNSAVIYRQSAPGSFSPYLTLNGGSRSSQTGIALTDSGNYVGLNSGLVSVWDQAGNFSNSFSLSGFAYSNQYPQQYRLTTLGDDYLLTYSNGTLSAWDYTGSLVDSALLAQAGQSFNSHFGFSYANGQFFVSSANGSVWRGYQIQAAATGPNDVPEPGALVLLSAGLIGLRFGLGKRKVKTK